MKELPENAGRPRSRQSEANIATVRDSTVMGCTVMGCTVMYVNRIVIVLKNCMCCQRKKYRRKIYISVCTQNEVTPGTETSGSSNVFSNFSSTFTVCCGIVLPRSGNRST